MEQNQQPDPIILPAGRTDPAALAKEIVELVTQYIWIPNTYIVYFFTQDLWKLVPEPWQFVAPLLLVISCTFEHRLISLWSSLGPFSLVLIYVCRKFFASLDSTQLIALPSQLKIDVRTIDVKQSLSVSL